VWLSGRFRDGLGVALMGARDSELGRDLGLRFRYVGCKVLLRFKPRRGDPVEREDLPRESRHIRSPS